MQANLSMTTPTSDSVSGLDAFSALKNSDEFVPLGAPPGLSLEPEDNELEAQAAHPPRTKLSLAQLMSGPADPQPVVCFPPGLGEVLDPPPGLLAKKKASKGSKSNGSESDTTAGGDSDPEPISLEMMLTDVSHLKKDAPLFVPKLAPEVAAMLPQIGPPQRTSLRSKANLYVPAASALPFVPMAEVEESWENWYAQHSSYTDWQGNWHAQCYPEAKWAY